MVGSWRAEVVGVLGALFAPTPGPVPWSRVWRAALAVPAPFAVGIALGRPAEGLLASIGTIPALNADRGGPYRLRAIRMGASVLAAAVGFLTGSAVRGHGLVAVAVVTAAAAVSAIVSAVGARTSIAALNFLVYAAISSIRAFPGPWWRTPILVAVGGLWAVALSVLFWVRRRAQPERDAVATAFDRLADLLDAVGTPGAEEARRAATVALNDADDAVTAARVGAGGQDRQWHRLLVALNATAPLIDASLRLLRRGERLPPACAAATRALGDAVRRDVDPPVAVPAALPGGTEAWASAWARTAAGVARSRRRPDRSPEGVPPRWAVRVRDQVEGPLSAAETWLAALRLGVCIAVAEALRTVVIQDRSYWIVLTVAVVMKPDFGSVFARAVQRAVGTAVGVVVGGLVMTLVPGQYPLVAFIAVFAALLPAALVRNYGMFSAALTPLVLLQIDALAPAPAHLVYDRLLDTALGAGIVMVLGYLLWPGTWRPGLGRRLAEAAEAVLDYLQAALGPARGDGPGPPGPAPSAARARRRAYRKLSDLRTQLQQSFADPAVAGRDARRLWPAAVALERFCDGVGALADEVAAGGRPPPADQVDALAEGIRRLGRAAADRRVPPELALPDTGPLAGLSAELDGARGAVTRLARRRLTGPTPRSATPASRR